MILEGIRLFETLMYREDRKERKRSSLAALLLLWGSLPLPQDFLRSCIGQRLLRVRGFCLMDFCSKYFICSIRSRIFLEIS